MQDFLSVFMDDAARAKILRAFILNEGRSLSLTDAAKRTALPAKQVMKEAAELEKWGVLKRVKLAPVPVKVARSQPKKAKNRKDKPESAWVFDHEFKYARALSSFVHEVSPIKYAQVLQALKRSGRIAAVILSGSFVGDPSRPADLIVAADALNERRLEQAMRELEPTLGREIRYAAFSTPEFRYRLTIQDRLMRDTLDFPHQVLFDRTRLL